MSERRNDFLRGLRGAALGITLGAAVLTTTGCDTSKQSAEAKFATAEQKDMNDFMDSYTQGKLDEMQKIINETEKQNKQLINNRDKAEKKGETEEHDLYATEQRFVENEANVMNYLISEKGGNASGGNKPASTSIFTKIIDGVTSIGNWIQDAVSGNPTYAAAVSAADYAYANPDWKPMADGFIRMYEESTEQKFQYDPATKTDPSKNQNGQNQTGDESNGQSDLVSGAIDTAGKFGEAVGTGFQNGVEAAKQANDEYNKQVQTDQYGHYVRVDETSIESAEEMQAKIDSGEYIYVPDPEDPTNFWLVENPDYEKVEWDLSGDER